MLPASAAAAELQDAGTPSLPVPPLLSEEVTRQQGDQHLQLQLQPDDELLLEQQTEVQAHQEAQDGGNMERSSSPVLLPVFEHMPGGTGATAVSCTQ